MGGVRGAVVLIGWPPLALSRELLAEVPTKALGESWC